MDTGWIVFVDADEWLTERAAGELAARLASVSGLDGLSGLVFAPKIIEEESGKSDDAVPRICRAESSIRFRGPVHGGHLDALIVALPRRFRGKSEAERYLDLCDPWTDMFFDRSNLRTAWSRPAHLLTSRGRRVAGVENAPVRLTRRRAALPRRAEPPRRS